MRGRDALASCDDVHGVAEARYDKRAPSRTSLKTGMAANLQVDIAGR
jgi:hypothetical protein